MSNNELKLTADVSIQAASAGKPKRIEILAYSGSTMSPPGWPNVIVDLAGLESPSTLTVLSDHDNRLSAIIASGVPVNDGRTLKLNGILANSEAANQVIALAKSGVALKASVGISPTKVERREKKGTVSINGRTIEVSVGTQIVRAGVLQEISVVAVPADTSSSVSIAASKRKNQMPVTEQSTTNPETDITTDIESNRQLLAAEHSRIHAINELCGDKHHDIASEAIRAGWDSNQTKLATLRASYSRGPSIHVSNRNEAVSRDILSCAIVRRANGQTFAEKCYPNVRTLEASDRFKHSSLLDIAKILNRHNGIETDNSSPDEVLRAAFTPGLRASSGFSTLGLADLLSDSASKSLKEFYTQTPASWRAMAGQLSTRDFKLNKSIGVALTGKLEAIGPSGEIKHQSLLDEAYPYRLDTYSAMLAITRQMIRNDDLSAFNELPRMFATMASRSLSDSFWSLVLANAGPHFSTGNKNALATGSGGALSITSLTSAILLLRKQIDLAGNSIDLAPTSLIVSPDLEMTARQLLNSAEVAQHTTTAGESRPTGNPLGGVANLVIEPRISNTAFTGFSVTRWYLTSAPQNMGTIIAFLDGKDTPTIESADTDFNTLGTQIRCYHDWGVAFGDKRACVMSPGA